MKEQPTGKFALVTGANKGIGLEIARQLGTIGITVFLGARDQDRGEAAQRLLEEEGLDVRFVEIDVTDQKTIDAKIGRASCRERV